MVDDQAVWLTPAAHRKLVDELQELMTNGRNHMSERIAEARSHGDISENGDYDAAKHEQGLMEARIRKLQHILDTQTDPPDAAATPWVFCASATRRATMASSSTTSAPSRAASRRWQSTLPRPRRLPSCSRTAGSMARSSSGSLRLSSR